MKNLVDANMAHRANWLRKVQESRAGTPSEELDVCFCIQPHYHILLIKRARGITTQEQQESHEVCEGIERKVHLSGYSKGATMSSCTQDVWQIAALCESRSTAMAAD